MDMAIESPRESGLFLKTILDNITSAIFILDDELRVQSVNNAFQNLFEKPAELFLDEPCGNAIGCEFAVIEGKRCGSTSQCNRCELRNSVLRTLTEKIPVSGARLTRNFLIDGAMALKHLQYSTRYIEYQGKNMVLIIIDDVTETETQKLRLEELNQTKNRFLGIAAHDLRNPLGVLKGFLDLFEHGVLGELNPQQTEVIGRLKSTSNTMVELVDNLLDLSAIEAGRVELRPRRIDLAAYLRDCHGGNELLARAKSIELLLEMEAGLPDVCIDPSRISQVINNLIANAIKFSHPGGRVRLGARRADDRADEN
ncbi:MAG: PAS domain-containing sensor histidine kinase, partial [bacterium]|nr:PAS domain-containing sensor histidine kinase [bacterium]